MNVKNVHCLNIDKVYEAARFVATYRDQVKHHNYTGQYMQKFFNIAQISVELENVNFVEAYALKLISTKFSPTRVYMHSTIGKFTESRASDDAIHFEKMSESILTDVINMEFDEAYDYDKVRLTNEFIASLPASFSCMDCNASFSGQELLRILSELDGDELIPSFESGFQGMYDYDLKSLSEFTGEQMDELYEKTCSMFTRKMFTVLYNGVIAKMVRASDDELSSALINGECKRELPDTAPALISYIKSECGAVDFIEDPKDVILKNLKDIKRDSKTPLEYTFSLKTSFFTFIALATTLPRGKVIILDEIANLDADIYKGSESIPKSFEQLTETLDKAEEDNLYKLRVKEMIVNYRVRLSERYGNFYNSLHELTKKNDLADTMMIHMSIPNQTKVHYQISITESDMDYIATEVFHSSEFTRVYNLIKSQILKLR